MIGLGCNKTLKRAALAVVPSWKTVVVSSTKAVPLVIFLTETLRVHSAFVQWSHWALTSADNVKIAPNQWEVVSARPLRPGYNPIAVLVRESPTRLLLSLVHNLPRIGNLDHPR